MELPRKAAWILRALEQKGQEAWVVGGCVRDCLLGRTPHDWDICTSALPEQAAACFPGLPVYETGLRHGTITLLLEGEPFEITTYRVDGTYTDSRHPDSVRFVRCLREDLARRDFTINAMAYHPTRGLADLFGGEADLRAGLVRCVGDPGRRFSEDALRMLRALRFASVYGFRLEAETEAAVRAGREGLRAVAAERIREELVRLLDGPGVERVLLSFPEVLAVFLPEVTPAVGFAQRNPHHDRDVWGHTARAVACAPTGGPVRLALLLHDLGKPGCYTEGPDGCGHFYGHAERSAELAADILARLRFDSAARDRVCALVRYHDTPVLPEPPCLKRWLNRIGEEALRQLLAVKRGDILAKSPVGREERLAPLEADAVCLEEVLAKGQCFQLRDLAVSGRDLLAAGLPAGPRLGRALDRLLELVIEERLPNERDALLSELPRLTDGEDADGRT